VGEHGFRLSAATSSAWPSLGSCGKAPRLILDEATSALDTASEREVQKALDAQTPRC
jgi:ATP-binding cassette subfamily B protein